MKLFSEKEAAFFVLDGGGGCGLLNNKIDFMF
jgi:hypothetical protein